MHTKGEKEMDDNRRMDGGNRPSPNKARANGGGKRPPKGGRPPQGGRPPRGGRPPQNGRPPQPPRRKPPRRAKKGSKIALFIIEILVLLVLLVVFWGASKASQIQYIEIADEEIEINEQVKEATETGALKGYRNIVFYAVDSNDKELTKNTRSDTMKIISINQDTKEIKMVSLLRDSYVNTGTDSYGKANVAYAKGGPKQSISMINMNLDLNVTDFVTVGYDAVIDGINALGGVEIDVQEDEIEHLNNYQQSIVGEPTGTYNAAGEPNYYAEAWVEYIPVTEPGLQTLDGLQAAAYCRIRYVGNDFKRVERQNNVMKAAFKKALTFDLGKLNKIAEAVFPKISTSLELSEILELMSSALGYEIGESQTFPYTYADETINRGRVLVPNTLESNVTQLHEFLFGIEDYQPSDTVKRISDKILKDAGLK